MTSNQYYGALNRRFDKRARFLIKLGFAYSVLPETNIAVFSRPRPFRFNGIAASAVMLAPPRVWRDKLPGLLQR